MWFVVFARSQRGHPDGPAGLHTSCAKVFIARDSGVAIVPIAGNLDCLGTPKGSGGYEALARAAAKMDVGGVTILVASLEDLIQMKRAAGRPKDPIEVEILAAVRDELGE
jgi:hypothetical protein